MPRINRSRGVPPSSNGRGVHTSRSEEKKAAGMFGITPTMVCGTSFKVILRPSTAGSLPSRFRQKLSLINATFAVISRVTSESDALAAAAFGLIPLAVGIGFLIDGYFSRREVSA